MLIETGSQNASSIPGVYAYPIHNYSNQALAPVARITGKPLDSFARDSLNPSLPPSLDHSRDIPSLREREGNSLSRGIDLRGEQKLDSLRPKNSYENTPYSNAAFYRGLLLNVSA